MDSERSYDLITVDDLKDLHRGSIECLREYYIHGHGKKWSSLYDIEKPLCVALCQGAAMHYHDGSNGIRDFDVWFFYPFNKRHLPYRDIRRWDYVNPKFGHHPALPSYRGRKVDVLVRSIRNFVLEDPIETIYRYFESEKTATSRLLARKAVVMLYPSSSLGQVIWYKKRIQ
ncbi:MAG: hypothetical protein ACFFEW_18730 [Candidatus Thorarchaeota archaeon]